MKQTFTASEVRDWERAYKGTGAAKVFGAFADLLEAQERAVPVMVVNHVSSAEHDLPIGMKLYAHPSPSDAERLAEALRQFRSYAVRCETCGDLMRLDNPAWMEVDRALAAHSAPAQPPAASVPDAPVPVFSWQPIETAPKNNKRPLFLARFNDDGSLQSFDYDAIWTSESESWELPEVYFFWASANGNVEEPTHWTYQPAGFGKIEAALAAQENPND